MSKLIFICTIILLYVSPAYSAISQDTGLVTLIFSNAGDEMAVSLDSGFPAATAAGQCGGSSWASIPKGMKPTVLLAKALGKKVTLETLGCHPNGGWLNAVNIYLIE